MSLAQLIITGSKTDVLSACPSYNQYIKIDCYGARGVVCIPIPASNDLRNDSFKSNEATQRNYVYERALRNFLL